MRKWFNQFSEWLVGFGIEPYLHILMTIVIAVMIAMVCYFTGADRTLAGYIGALLAFLVGFVKESWDNKKLKCKDDDDNEVTDVEDMSWGLPEELGRFRG